MAENGSTGDRAQMGLPGSNVDKDVDLHNDTSQGFDVSTQMDVDPVSLLVPDDMGSGEPLGAALDMSNEESTVPASGNSKKVVGSSKNNDVASSKSVGAKENSGTYYLFSLHH
jgi:hypothetical protein